MFKEYNHKKRVQHGGGTWDRPRKECTEEQELRQPRLELENHLDSDPQRSCQTSGSQKEGSETQLVRISPAQATQAAGTAAGAVKTWE